MTFRSHIKRQRKPNQRKSTQRKPNRRKSTRRKPIQRKSIKKKMKSSSFIRQKYAGGVLGQGTHGTITIHPQNDALVVKSYIDDATKHKYRMGSCFTDATDDDISEDSTCGVAKMEYNIQEYISNRFKQADLSIVVPSVSDFGQTANKCSYAMDRIFPLNDNGIIVVNMYDPSTNRVFSHSASGIELGSANIPWPEYGYSDGEEFAFDLGSMFSYLHYVMNMDGYDCELLLGKTKGEGKAFLIDFDKVSCLKYILGETVHRKLDESTYEPKELKTMKKYAMFLFTAMISMSLIPVGSLQSSFIRGYRVHVPTDATNMKSEIAQHVIEFIQEYE